MTEPHQNAIEKACGFKLTAAHELKTQHPILQRLALVTLGDATPAMLKVIDAARKIIANAAE